jgi:phage repressor protein C with HTH and peptisase S24 domain
MAHSNFISYWRQARGLTQKKLALSSGIQQSYLSQLERGNRAGSPETLRAIAKILNVSTDELIEGPKSKDHFIQIPYWGNEQYMDGGEVMVSHYKIEYGAGNGVTASEPKGMRTLPFREEWIRKSLQVDPQNLVMVDVSGDSMEPTLNNGEAILVDRSKRELKHDGIYVFQTNSELFVKRIMRQMDGKILVVSDNKKYESYVLDVTATNVFGRVVWRAGMVK